LFLKRIQLSNVRCLRTATLEFERVDSGASSRQWTVILGENGLGKSTLLKSIALVTAGSDALTDLLRDPDSWIHIGSKEARIEADLETADGEPRHASLVIRRGRGISKVLSDNVEGLAEIDRAFEYTARSYFVVGYGVSRRLPRDKSTVAAQQTRTPRAAAVATLFDPDVPLNSLETWAMDLDYRHGRKALAVISETLNSTLPQIKFHGVNKRKRQLMFNTPDGRVPLSGLSDGYQNVAGWLGDLVFNITETFKDFKRPLATRGLLLIDEIDLHLHPAWQRQLRDYLTQRLPNFQMIATTHSALTAHQTQAGELHYLQRLKGGPQLSQFLGNASHLALTQLIASPIFGLETLDSLEVQKKKTEYRQLKAHTRSTRGRKARRIAEPNRLKTLAKELRDIPNPTELTSQERKFQITLESIHKELAALTKKK